MSVRKSVDDTLDGDVDDVADPSVRALVRAVRLVADGIDRIDDRVNTATTRIAQVGGGIIVSVLSAAILLALQSK